MQPVLDPTRSPKEVELEQALGARAQIEAELRAEVERESAARVRAEATLTSRDLFLGMLGHDLRNPLNTVLMTAQLMEMRGEIQPASKPRLDRIIANGLRMQRMIAQIMDMTTARFEDRLPLAVKDEDLGALLAEVVEEVRNTYPNRVFEVHIEPALRSLMDRDRVEQVILTLVTNAIVHGSAETPVDVSLTRAGDSLVLRVHNVGPTIPSEVLVSLFQPFGRGDRRRGHATVLGLGLYIAERVMHAHAGALRATSSDDTGTSFVATFPTSPR